MGARQGQVENMTVCVICNVFQFRHLSEELKKNASKTIWLTSNRERLA